MQAIQQHATVLDGIVKELAGARRVLFITGAGLSADSGLPTYRGVGGLYEGTSAAEGMPIETLLSGTTFRERPELIWKYLFEADRSFRNATYNNGHRIIANFEHKFEHVVVLTQNVDGFHQRAGSKNVIDIHGDMHVILCTRCAKKRRVASYVGLEALPKCACGGVERPDVVLFGENLPEEKLRALHDEVRRGFDIVFSIGTSGTFPYVRMPMIRAQVNGWPSVDINPRTTAMTTAARYHLPLRAAEACEALWLRILTRR